MRLYAIYDRVAEESGPIFEAKNDLIALRMTEEFISKHPDDYWVMYIGDYSHDPVRITPVEYPLRVYSSNCFVEDEQ